MGPAIEKIVQFRRELLALLELMNYSHLGLDVVTLLRSLKVIRIQFDGLIQDLVLNFFSDYGPFFAQCSVLHFTIETELQLYTMARAIYRLPKIKEVAFKITSPFFTLGSSAVMTNVKV